MANHLATIKACGICNEVNTNGYICINLACSMEICNACFPVAFLTRVVETVDTIQYKCTHCTQVFANVPMLSIVEEEGEGKEVFEGRESVDLEG